MLSARQHFPGALDKVFLDAACCSIASRPSIEAVEKFLGIAMTCPHPSSTHHHIFMDEMRAAARPAVARFLNADENEIALVESTSHGLAIAAHAIPLEPGDRVLLPDLEFMQVSIPWLQKQRDGIQLDLVPNRGGATLLEDIAGRITPRTRVVAVSSVQWSNGDRLDMAGLSRLCRERSLWLVVDAIQQLGAMAFDVRETPVDFLATGGHKWLNAPYGCGFLYINKDALPRLRPPIAGYLSVKPPSGGWGHYFQTPTISPLSDFRYVSAARVYEHGGTANYPGAVGLAAALQLIHALGPANIEAHIRTLTDKLIAGLDALNLEVVTPRPAERRSGIVTFSAGSSEKNVAWMNQLLEKKILVSVRYTSNVGGIRVSSHVYNTPDDIDRLLTELKALCSQPI